MRVDQFLKFVLPAFVLCFCSPPKRESSNGSAQWQEVPNKFASRFSIARQGDDYLLSIFGNRNDHNVTACYILSKDTSNVADAPAGSIKIKVPCRHIAALGSIYATMLEQLGGVRSIGAVDNMDYVVNPAVRNSFEAGYITEVQKMPEPDVEKLIDLKPDAILMFGMGMKDKDISPSLLATRLPVIVSVDHLEATPLARAEWIKVAGLLLNKFEVADSIVNGVAVRYDSIVRAGSRLRNRPTVFSELKYGDTWYVPGGKSFMAQLIRDAGGKYLWETDTQPGSLALGFEAVLSKGANADIWINVSMCQNRKQMLAQEPRYQLFRAFRERRVYNNNLHQNSGGYTDYWETGMIYPDRILSDLQKVFSGAGMKDMYYYQRLE